ncbi:MAG: hypothetical protein IT497_03485 [Ottowia sp.]|nr:hypothetical protein [Ottowia sp.]
MTGDERVFVNFKKWLISVFNPPYQLSLSDKTLDKKSGLTIYVFKQYGGHDYIKITYADILNNYGILSAINPIHLMDIHLNEYLIKQETEKCYVIENLRNNKYKISNQKVREIYSGEHICTNIDMFANVSHSDICKIAYQSGFIKGRKFSHEIKAIIQENKKITQEVLLSKASKNSNVINLATHRS